MNQELHTKISKFAVELSFDDSSKLRNTFKDVLLYLLRIEKNETPTPEEIESLLLKLTAIQQRIHKISEYIKNRHDEQQQ